MGIRLGESWQARNGHRRFVSVPLHDLILSWGLGAWLVLPLWFTWKLCTWSLRAAAECALLALTAVLAVIAVARHEARWSDVGLTRLRFGLRMVDVR
jgi:hypothetical protein